MPGLASGKEGLHRTERMSILAPLLRAADIYVEQESPKKPCRLTGNAKPGSTMAAQNTKKNRWTGPGAQDIDPKVTLAAMIKPGNDRNRFNKSRAARIVGFVADVKPKGSIESCNCKAPGPLDQDTHIDVVLDPATAKVSRTYVIVEVTPRLREER